MSPMTAPDPERIRNTILEAADARFGQYGYGKTTMAEIARDCDMSAANLYRYFDSKADIGAELARACLADKEARLATVIQKHGDNVEHCVEHWFVETLHATWEVVSDLPRLNELVDDICQRRSDIVFEHYSRKRDMLRGVIEQSVARGEFTVEDANQTADSILSAAVPFDVPHFMHMCTLEQHEYKARCLARLLVNGIGEKNK